jgi:hypothetical protein
MKTRLIFIFIFKLYISVLNLYSKEIDYPSWIQGAWHNSAESNYKNFIFFNFQ